MAAKTTPAELERLATLLSQEAARLETVRAELRRIVLGSRGEWEGLVADRFRGHTGAEHRQHHLEVARDRLLRAASLARQAARELTP
jgi:hypothetical protein